MEVNITNAYLENSNYNSRLFQPKYYFGQILKDKKCRIGIVVEMGCDTGWYYSLLDLKTNKVLNEYNEDELIATTTEDPESATTLPSLSIIISNKHLEANNIDLRFGQPKYYFGQLLKELSGFSGIVVQMGFKREWEYELLELTTKFPPMEDVYPEARLVAVEPALLTQK